MDWQAFLAEWSERIMRTVLADAVQPPPTAETWLGYPGASERELKALEKRLGLTLPPSYRSFLELTNGWRRTTTFIGRIRPASEVARFAVENQNWIDAHSESGSESPDEQYYDYDENGAPDHRGRHMAALVQISDVDDGVYLLNPNAVTDDGEWEAWFFADWIPGAQRYPSFAHLMMGEYRSMLRVQGLTAAASAIPSLLIPSPRAKRKPAKRIGGRARQVPVQAAALIQDLESANTQVRTKAIRTLAGRLKGRERAERQPELVKRLTELFYASAHAEVRGICVSMLTEVAVDGDAPRPLFDALSDPDAGVVLTGIFALYYFPNRDALEPLCRFIDSRVNVLFNESAISALGKMRDDRAVPTLTRVLLDTSNQFDQNFGTAAMALARCGPGGVDTLIAASTNADPRIRHAAAAGLDLSDDARAGAVLDALSNDENERVRTRASQRIGDYMRWLM